MLTIYQLIQAYMLVPEFLSDIMLIILCTTITKI